MKKSFITLIACAITGAGQLAGQNLIWADEPAKDWQKDALPIGNGRLGCMIFGGIQQEHLQFNEDTLWIGDETDTGAYQNFGDMLISFETPAANAQGPISYRRELNLDKSLHSTSYQNGGVKFRREYFASHPANVLVFRLTADKPGAYSGILSLKDSHGATVTAENNRIGFSGALSGKYGLPAEQYAISLSYEAQALVLNQGGSVSAADGVISFKGCDSLTILLDAGTDYLNRRDKRWKQEHPHLRISQRLTEASRRSFADLLAEHVKDYQQLFNRVTLDLGQTSDETLKLSTAQRVAAYQRNQPDPDLEETLFHYARYLMISSSRHGCMPANLQGLWNHSNQPPWRSDYHTDVNVEMNYWFVDQANLAECFSPLAEWVNSIREVRREATRKEFNVRGWATRSENGIFGGASYHWVPGDASWVAQNLWDHYAFTLDKEYLRSRAYPVMKELCEFWEDSLIKLPDGRLVSPKSQSPEHGPFAEGNSYEQQLAWDLFTNYIEASEALAVDDEFRRKVAAMKEHLLGPQIGKWGQLQEWAEDLDDPNDQHRHLSHLIAVHPGRQITPLTTPELAAAARVSMNGRGDGGTGWSKAWKISIWARLHDGDRAYKLLGEFIKNNVYPNLFGYHPPFQIDCNFGYAAGVCEMLVQSHTGRIHLLPSLPAAWPVGRINGLKARGGFELDVAWRDGELTRAAIRSANGTPCVLSSSVPLAITCSGKPVPATVKENIVTFATESGGEYLVTPL